DVSYDLGQKGATVIETSLFILALASIAGLTWLLMNRRPSPRSKSGEREVPPRPASAAKAATPPVSYTTESIEATHAGVYKLAFGVTHADYQIRDEHAEVLVRIRAALEQSVHQREYFPRRPMLLPRLMQALNDPEISREALVKLILEDPSIAGG